MKAIALTHSSVEETGKMVAEVFDLLKIDGLFPKNVQDLFRLLQEDPSKNIIIISGDEREGVDEVTDRCKRLRKSCPYSFLVFVGNREEFAEDLILSVGADVFWDIDSIDVALATSSLQQVIRMAKMYARLACSEIVRDEYLATFGDDCMMDDESLLFGSLDRAESFSSFGHVFVKLMGKMGVQVEGVSVSPEMHVMDPKNPIYLGWVSLYAYKLGVWVDLVVEMDSRSANKFTQLFTGEDSSSVSEVKSFWSEALNLFQGSLKTMLDRSSYFCKTMNVPTFALKNPVEGYLNQCEGESKSVVRCVRMGEFCVNLHVITHEIRSVNHKPDNLHVADVLAAPVASLESPDINLFNAWTPLSIKFISRIQKLAADESIDPHIRVVRPSQLSTTLRKNDIPQA